MTLTTLLAVVAAPFAVALVIACLRDPMHVALPLFAALIPFGGRLAVGTSSFGSLSSLVGLLLAAGLALQLTSRRSARNLSPAVAVWLLFLGVASATALWTLDERATLSGLAVLGSLVAVYSLTAIAPVDRAVLRRVEDGLIVGGVAAVGYGLFQLFVQGGFPGDTAGEAVADAGVAADGRFGNDLLGPGLEAVALLFPLAICLHRMFLERSPVSRAVHGAGAAVLLWGVLMTGSRTGTLAVAVSLLALLVATPGRPRRGIAVCLVLAVAVAGLVWRYHPAGVATRTFSSVTSSSGRTDIWEVGLAACPNYCGIGSGWGTYPDVYAQTQASVPSARVLAGAGGSYQAHNLWLLVVVEAGLAGLVLLTAGMVLAAVQAIRLPVRRRGPPVAAVAGLVFALFFLSSMEFKFFWMVMIMVALHRNVAADEAAGDVPAGALPSTTGAG